MATIPSPWLKFAARLANYSKSLHRWYRWLGEAWEGLRGSNCLTRHDETTGWFGMMLRRSKTTRAIPGTAANLMLHEKCPKFTYHQMSHMSHMLSWPTCFRVMISPDSCESHCIHVLVSKLLALSCLPSCLGLEVFRCLQYSRTFVMKFQQCKDGCGASLHNEVEGNAV